MFNRTDKKTTIEYARDFETPSVFINKLALMKMKQYVEQSSNEIAWLGVIERIPNTTEADYFYIEDVMLVEQEATGTTVELTEQALSKLGSELITTDRSHLFNKIRMWGHSHVNMAVFSSGTDDDTFESFYKDSDYFIRLIANKKGDLKIDLMDSANGIKFLNLPWYVKLSEEEKQIEKMIEDLKEKDKLILKGIEEEVKKEIDTNIIKKTYKYHPTASSGYNSTYYDYEDYECYSNAIGYKDIPTSSKKSGLNKKKLSTSLLNMI